MSANNISVDPDELRASASAADANRQSPEEAGGHRGPAPTPEARRTRPGPVAIRRLKNLTRISLAALALLTSAACMNGGGKNEPLPVKGQKQAEQMARGLLDSLAAEYGLKIDDKSVNSESFNCYGKNRESANDGRYTLNYAARARIFESEHGKAIRAMRKRLEADGYRIVGYREDKAVKPWALLDAKGGKDNLFVSVESYMPSDQLTFSVDTPCFLPPGTKQEQVSAPAPTTVPKAPVSAANSFVPTTRFPDNPFG
ncbi:hypothetical protein [Streptomyces sp. NPDC003077]|uniref:hypothetical protein n=1 Tax=Streptomyces sp. NPDC003077 TaxID=3154443 RepID=UPI0033B7EDC0